jgi:hypothetical protein
MMGLMKQLYAKRRGTVSAGSVARRKSRVERTARDQPSEEGWRGVKGARAFLRGLAGQLAHSRCVAGHIACEQELLMNGQMVRNWATYVRPIMIDIELATRPSWTGVEMSRGEETFADMIAIVVYLLMVVKQLLVKRD